MRHHNPDEYPQPKYKFGEKVKIKVETTDQATGAKFINTLEMYIRSIFADSNERVIEYKYGLTTDLPRGGYSGAAACKQVREFEIIVDALPSSE